MIRLRNILSVAVSWKAEMQFKQFYDYNRCSLLLCFNQKERQRSKVQQHNNPVKQIYNESYSEIKPNPAI